MSCQWNTPVPPHGAVDNAMPAQSGTVGPSIAEALQALDELCCENDVLKAENADLRTRLATAQQQRDTAQVQLTHHTRRGW